MSPSPTSSRNNSQPANRDERNLSVALHHANLLQQRKGIESAIFASLEKLIDFPLSARAVASAPSSSDLSNFQQMILPFQVSDYDDLLEERNIAGKCGYVFCPRPYAKETRQRGIVQFIRTGTKGDFKIIPTDELRKWCSSECARRAMFIKVQLSEVPAWERAGGLGKKVEVLREADEEAMIRGMEQLEVAGGEEDEEMQDTSSDLAMERGEKKNSYKHTVFLNSTVVEKATNNDTVPIPPSTAGNSHDIEGYTPKGQRHRGANGDDGQDSDWDLT